MALIYFNLYSVNCISGRIWHVPAIQNFDGKKQITIADAYDATSIDGPATFLMTIIHIHGVFTRSEHVVYKRVIPICTLRGVNFRDDAWLSYGCFKRHVLVSQCLTIEAAFWKHVLWYFLHLNALRYDRDSWAVLCVYLTKIARRMAGPRYLIKHAVDGRRNFILMS